MSEFITESQALDSTTSHFFLDPSLVDTMDAADISDPAHSPYKTNLGLLVDAMETSDTKPGAHMQPRPITSEGAPPVINGNDIQAHTSYDPQGKRKRDQEAQPDESSNEANRRRTQELPRPRPGDVPTACMTHVTCLHAAVAQKSYGHEKRFLCPPPLVRVHTPIHAIKDQKFTMAVVTEDGQRLAEQPCPMDSVMQFKFLHVGGASSKSKSFHLTLDVLAPDSQNPTPPPPAANNANAAQQQAFRRWASFESGAVTIISKPSKKTAKTRNISTCIMNGSSISLFNRINSQTVRTKYMTVDRHELAASNMSWSAFRITMLDDEDGNALNGGGASRPHSNVAHPIHYGARVVLTDEATGISSEPLIVRKVDKGRLVKNDISPTPSSTPATPATPSSAIYAYTPQPGSSAITSPAGGLVSQMQKIALQRASSSTDKVHAPPGGLFLSAGRVPLPNPGAGSNERSVVGGSSTSFVGESGRSVSTAHPLSYQAPRGSGGANGNGEGGEGEAGASANGTRTSDEADEVDDFLCWTIVGIAEYQYTFFDASSLIPPLSIPANPITPFPITVLPPQYHLGTHRLEMQVLHFFSADPRTNTPVGMEIWLGSMGPLGVTTAMPPAQNASGPPPYNNTQSPYTAGPPQSPYTPMTNGSAAPGAPAGGLIGPNGEPLTVGMGVPPFQPTMPPGSGPSAPTAVDGQGQPVGRHTSLDPPGTRRTNDPVMVIYVDLPPMHDILQEVGILGANGAGGANGQPPVTENKPAEDGSGGTPQQPQPHRPLTLPIIFVRPYDLVGYMTGYSVVLENVFGNGVTAPGGGSVGVSSMVGVPVQGMGELQSTQGWTLRVV